MLTRQKPEPGRFVPHPPSVPKQQIWHETGRQYQNRLRAELASGGSGSSGSSVGPLDYSSDEDHDGMNMDEMPPLEEQFVGLDRDATDDNDMRFTQRIGLPQLPLGNITMRCAIY